MSREWSAFYDAVADRPPHETLVQALDLFDAEPRERLAVDLGCGDGRDAVELLRRGWRVVAIDAEQEAIERLRARVGEAAAGRLETEVARFESAEWPAADLVNCGFALPFCPPAAFPAVWARIVSSLRPGGRFSGQLFGERDGWSGRPHMSFHARAEVERLLAGFDVERLAEVDEDGTTALGVPKHWHVFHVVARKRADG